MPWDLLQIALEFRSPLYQCGQVARALQGLVQREDKAPDSPVQRSTAVSVVDRLCQEIILLRAHELVPGVVVHSEELAACPPELLALFEGNQHQYALIIDPVDGTEDYLDGRPTYAHMLGLLDQAAGRMVAGLIYLPATQRLVLGLPGVGAHEAYGFYVSPLPLQPAAPPRSVGRTKRITEADYRALQGAGFQLVPNASRSAAWELLRVADGELGAAVMRDFHGYDSAVAAAILEALGGATLGPDGQPVRYTAEMPRLPLVVASLRPDWAAEIVALLAAGEPA